MVHFLGAHINFSAVVQAWRLCPENIWLNWLQAFAYSWIHSMTTDRRARVNNTILHLDCRCCFRRKMLPPIANENCWWCHYWALRYSIRWLHSLTCRDHPWLSWWVYNPIIYIGSLNRELKRSSLFLLTHGKFRARKRGAAVIWSSSILIIMLFLKCANTARAH